MVFGHDQMTCAALDEAANRIARQLRARAAIKAKEIPGAL